MRFFSWPTVITFSLLIFVLSISPIGVAEEIVFPFLDKFFHGLAYFLLSFVTVNTFRKANKKHAVLGGFIYSFSLSILIEIAQYFIPYRSFQVTDIAANFLGSFLGCLLRVI
ncbi:MAG: VanZ family protein [Candidatus Omnitrophica bacterium]|nr:VanZ family protein [Candidatus Omnitrophota bacterium]